MPSESPKWIALVLSLIAITISGLSWWESRQNRAINAATNRPVLVAAIDTEYEVPKEQRNIYVKVPVKIKNIGNGTAAINRVEFRVMGSMPRCVIKNEERGSLAGITIPQGLEAQLPGGFYMSPECPKQWTGMFLYLSIYYTDEGSGQQYNQDFSQFLDMKYKSKIPKPVIIKPDS